MQFKPNIGSYV